MSAKALESKQFSARAAENTEGLSTKRLIFLASLYFKLRSIKSPTKDQLIQMNKRFGLAFREGALKLPAAMSDILWGKTCADKAFETFLADDKQLDALACDLVDGCPKWARYADRTCLIRDTKAVFCFTRAQM